MVDAELVCQNAPPTSCPQTYCSTLHMEPPPPQKKREKHYQLVGNNSLWWGTRSVHGQNNGCARPHCLTPCIRAEHTQFVAVLNFTCAAFSSQFAGFE